MVLIPSLSGLDSNSSRLKHLHIQWFKKGYAEKKKHRKVSIQACAIQPIDPHKI
jgi:hypothetical protein